MRKANASDVRRVYSTPYFSEGWALYAERGMRDGEQFSFLAAEGGTHNEASWGGRFDQVLRFLFPDRRE